MVKIGIVGIGFMGHQMAHKINALSNCEVVSICDQNTDLLTKIKEEIKVQTYTDYKKMFKESGIDGVYNCTPDSLHKQIALDAFAHGIHVFSEKPLAENVDSANEMYLAATKSGLVNMVNFTYRNSSALYAVKELVNSGHLGEITHVEGHYLQDWLSNGSYLTEDAFQWRLATEYGSLGTLGDTGVHILDFVSFVAGDIRSLNCKLHTFENIKGKGLGKYSFDANDSAIINVQFENDALGTIHATRWASGKANSVGLEIYGTKGGAKIDLDKGFDQYELCESPTQKDWKNVPWKTIETKTMPIVAERFATAIEKKSKNFEPDFMRGAQMQKLIEICMRSDIEKSWLDV